MNSPHENSADDSVEPALDQDEVIEIPVQAGNSMLPSSRRTSQKTPGSWIGRILVFGCLIAIAIFGFGSSAGWFDTKHQPPDGIDAPLAAGGNSTSAESSAFSASAQRQAEQSAAGRQIDPSQIKPDQPGAGQAAANASSGNLAESLPPLNALMSEDSQLILAECKRVSKHMQNVLPASPAAREMVARVEFEFGDVEKARKIWQELLDANPNYVYALRGLGDICTNEGDFQGAVTYFRRAVLADPDNVARQITLGVALTQAGELEQAKEVLETVLASLPEHGGAHLELGSVLSQLSDFEGAKTHFEAALDAAIAPSDPSKAHFGLIKVYQRLRDKEKAAYHQAEYKQLESSKAGERQEGRRDYDDVQAISEDVGNFYVDMARVYLSGGLPKSAELLLLRASEMNPKNIDCRQALAFIAVRQGKFFDAIRWLQELSALVPTEFSFPQEIARIYVQLGQARDAEKVLIDFVQANPGNGTALRSVTEFYVETQLGIDQAIEYAIKTTEVAPTADNLALLASLYATSDKLPEAIEVLERAAKIDPTNVSYAQNLMLLKEKLAESEGNAVP